jgi:hypothetical protein
MIGHMTLEEDESGNFYIAVDGERVGSKTCNFTTSTTVGSLPSGTKLESVEPADVLEQMLVAKFPPSLSFTSSLAESVIYEIGDEQEVTLETKATKQSYYIKKLEISSTPSLAEFTKTVTTAPWTHSGTVTISDTQTVTAKATDIEGLSNTKTIKYNFVYPLYASYVDTTVTTLDDVDIISGQKVIIQKGAITLAYSSNNTLLRPVFAYPKIYGKLSSIQDVLNKIELISNYELQELQIECLDGDIINYYAYVANTEAILDNFEIRFSW